MNRFLQWLFLAFLFFLPFQTVFLLREPFIGGEKWQYGMIGVYAIDILLVIILGLVLVRWLRSIKYKVSGIQYGEAAMMLMILVVSSGASVLWANDQVLSLYFFVKLLLGASLFFVVRSLDASLFKKAIFVLLLAGVVQSSIGIGQFVYQYSPGSTWLGIGVHEVSQAGSSVLKLDSGRFLRAYGTFPHPNMLGGFLGAILMLGSMYYVSGIRYEKSWKCLRAIAFTLSGLLVIFLGLILTFSRTAWLGVGLGIVAIGLYAFRQDDSWIRGRFLKIFLALGLAALVFGSVLHEQVFPRFDTVIIEREGSVSERFASLQDAQALIAEQPIIGVGAGSFTAEIMWLQPERPVWNIQPAHNVFMLVWSELGLIGLMIFGAFLFHIVTGSNKNAIFGIALLALVPSLFLDHWLFTSHFGLLFFFLLLGISQNKNRSNENYVAS